MWFGLIPSPYRMARRAMRPRRTFTRSCARQPTYRHTPVTTTREQCWWWTGAAGLTGLLITLSNNPNSLPVYPTTPAPRGWLVDTAGNLTPNGTENTPLPAGTVGWISPITIHDTIQSTWTWFTIGLVLLAGAIVTGIALHRTASGDNNPPPAGPPQPAPLPQPDLVRTRSGHKPLNRELPMDRPHPWRTWEG